MAFDYESARTAQQRYIDQSVASRIDAEAQRRLADEARQRGDLDAQRDHMARAAVHDDQRAKIESLTQDMQQQMQAAYAAEQQRAADERQAAEEDQKQRALETAEQERKAAAERQATKEREIEAAEQARAAAEEARRQQERERQAAEQARQRADQHRQTAADRILSEARERAARLERGRGDEGRER